jgi:antitoxin component YwqK of YwqJK toxin-antitoxin module
MADPPAEPREEVSRDDRGRLRERKFTLRGKIEGEYTSYFANGQVMVRMGFCNGRKEGEAVSFYPDGQMREKGLFKNDKLEG